MTTYATFIINGCERVIVSQIIRSPGIYFEKNKSQKNQKQFKRKLSTDINKLRSFLPSGEAFISELDLFFSVPTTIYDKTTGKKKLIPNWDRNTISYYSIRYLQESNQNSIFHFLQSFKFYHLISKNLVSNSKNKLIKIFLKWLKLKDNSIFFPTKSNLKQTPFLLNYFQSLLELLIKYQLLELAGISESDVNLVKTNKLSQKPTCWLKRKHIIS